MSYQLKIKLQDITPQIWRRVIVPAHFTLGELHYVIQIAMGWEDAHLHEFVINRQRYRLPFDGELEDAVDERTTQLRDVARAGSKFTYYYDFGDFWIHLIHVEKAADDGAVEAPTCVDGARACPPEDSGGPWGYLEKVAALSDPDDDDTEELREWMGDFDPESFDLASVNRILRGVFRKTSKRKR
ncbi:MAG: plasmid pRiA4b ORF-3 family protein [Thermoanaerobaculia bacterium]